MGYVDESALTELNLCSVLSEKKEHHLAKKHVESAIRKLEVLERNKENESLLAIAHFTLGC